MREVAFGQHYELTCVDRFGISLSHRQFHRHVPDWKDLRIADFGCGYQAAFTRSVLSSISEAFLIDLAFAPELRADPKLRLCESTSPIETDSLDVVIANSVLEHLEAPEATLKEFFRILRPGGLALVNVPSWRGKFWLELFAFRLGLSPAAEMEDHKRYYDVRDLWPQLVAVGFKPSRIRCFSHKFGLNTFAVCRK